MQLNNEVSKIYIRNKLTVNANVFKQGEFLDNNSSSTHIPALVVTSEYANKLIIENEKSSLKRIIINILYKNKDSIKKLPIIGKKVIKTKNKYLKEAVSKSVSTIDLKPYLLSHYTVFIQELYKLTLHRLPDEYGMNSMLNMVKRGASNGALVYVVAVSEEFKKTRLKIKDFNYYKKLYKKYVIKNRVKKIPIIGRIVKLYALTQQISVLSDDISFLLGKVTNEVNGKINSLYDKVGEYNLNNNNKFDEINRMFEDVDIHLNSQNEKLDSALLISTTVSEKLAHYVSDINRKFDDVNNKFDNVVTEIEQNISVQFEEIEYTMNVQKIINAGLPVSRGMENIQAEYINLLNDKNYETEAYDRLPIEILTNYAEGKTVAAAHYSKLISEYADANKKLEIETAGIEPSILPDVCKGKDTLIIANPALSALLLASPDFLMEISRTINRNLVLSVWTSIFPIHAIWDGFGFVEKEEGKGFFKWAEGRNGNWQIRIFNSLNNSVKTELTWSSESLLGTVELTASCCGKTVTAKLNGDIKFKLNVILRPGVNTLNFFLGGGAARPEGNAAYRWLAFRVIDFTCQAERQTINQELLYTNSRQALLGDDYIRRQLHKNGFYDIQANAYSNHGFNIIKLPDSRYNYMLMAAEHGNYSIDDSEQPEIPHGAITLYSAYRLRKTDSL